jgi:hypothetical protein
MIDNTTMTEELLACSAFTQDAEGLVRVDPAVLQRAAELLAQSANKDLSALQQERDALGWATMRMSVALRLLNASGMKGVSMPGSGILVPWLSGWIDAGMDEPLHWPSAVPFACQLLTSWGFQDVGGFIGKTMPTDGRAGQRTQ